MGTTWNTPIAVEIPRWVHDPSAACSKFKVATCTISTGACDRQSSKRCIGGAGNFSGKSYDAICRIYRYDPPPDAALSTQRRFDFEIDKR